MRDHHSLSSLKKIIRDPSKLREVGYYLKKDIYDVFTNINRLWYKKFNQSEPGEFITDEWDTLVILDAARPEYLKENMTFSNENWSYKYSPASYSYGFMESEFKDQELHDIVYVTGNPYISRLQEDIFHDIINLYESAWDDDQQTVKPSKVVEYTKKARDQYPNKRFIVHFMQPHFPFIASEYQEKISGRIANELGDGTGVHPWNSQMYRCEDNHEDLIQAYKDNHKLVLPLCKKVAEDESGQTVITADHANLIGERGFPIPIKHYGHPADFPHPSLLRVPWITIGSGNRKTTADKPVDREDVSENTVSERLSALGYKE
ncbi:hypothetical protein [Haloparvum sp. AD34]